MTENKYIVQLKEMVLDFLRDKPIRVILYGSRARGDHRPGSDVDLALSTEGEIDRLLLANLRELLEESTIPYKVDIIDLKHTSEVFQAEIMKEAIVWKN